LKRELEVESKESVKIRRTMCQICKCDCGIIAYIENGKIVRVEGDKENPNNRGKLCVKGKNSLEILYHKDRLTTPLLNVGERGAPEWEKIDWDRALEIIKRNLKELREKYGPESLVFLHGPTGRIVDRSMVKRFANLYGTPNVTGSWSYCVGPKVLGYMATFGTPLYPTCDFVNANFIMLWGTNPAVSKIHRYHGVVEDIMTAKKRGAPVVVVDPRKSETARVADYHLKIRPNSDIYLALGMIQYIIENDLYDHDFVERYTTGFEELASRINGYDLDRVEKRTDIPASLIREVTELFVESRPASIDRREGILHSVNGLQTARAIAILMALTGNVDVKGGLIFNPSITLKDITLREMLPDGKKPFWGEKFPLALDCSGYLSEVILSEKPYPIKAMIVFKSNPVLTLPNTHKFVKAMKKLEFIAVHDIFLTETCNFADLVLPASTFYEKAEIDAVPLKKLRWIRVRRRIVEPLQDSKSEAEFMSMLGARMGYEEYFNFQSEDEILMELLRGSEVERYSLEELEKGVLVEEIHPGYFRDRGFNTPSGRIELVSSILKSYGMDIPEPVSHPAESDDYPYLLITGARTQAYYHSQFRNIERLRRLNPDPVAEVGGGIARHIRLSDRDTITIETHTGSIEMKATIKQDMHPFTVSIPHGWVECNANLITDDMRFEPLTGAPMYRGIPCRVKKI
jgi:anaerobic selenocysteine-containing dehydrogenase